MDPLRAVSHRYYLTHGQRPTIGVDLDPAPEAGLGSVGPAPTAAAESRNKNADEPRDMLLSADPIEVSLFMRARTDPGRSRRSRTEFDGSSGCYCHHAHLAQAGTGRGGYGVDKEPKSGLFWSALRTFRILPFWSSSVLDGSV